MSEHGQIFLKGPRSAVGERGSGAQNGEKRLAERTGVPAIRGFRIGHPTNHFNRNNIKPESQAGLSMEFDHFSHYLPGGQLDCFIRSAGEG